MIVCLDTHYLIWEIKREASFGQENQILRTQQLMVSLTEKKHNIIIPAPVVTEFLLGVPPCRYALALQELKKIEIVPFDLAAAVVTARLWREKNEGRQYSEKLKVTLDGKTRAAVKVDCQIVGIAISRKAECIYSYDQGVRAFAQNEIRVLEAPPALIQKEAAFTLKQA